MFAELLSSDTLTGKYLRNIGAIIPATEFEGKNEFYNLTDVSKFDIKHFSAKFPKRALTVITGVAGSGKSTLISVFKEQYPDAVILDQKPIHSSIRSTLLTYLGIFDSIRNMFSEATEKSASMFSYNGKETCSVCKGKGIIKLDLSYLGSSYETCEACGGALFK
ncbi:ATP-binding cassette domain-containing protein [Oenococcus oeni]|uniref:ATP-binding cassette domain-containing protein n=1 Tax=Oenococcus oeni TaxID=1247 RepID=UPI00107953A2